MPEITEIAWLPLKADSEGSETAEALKKMGPELLSRPGLKASYHGKVVEMPNSIEIVSVWESEQAYKDGHAAGASSEASKLMQSLVDTSDPTRRPYHNSIAFDKPFADVAAAPCVSMAAIFLPTDADLAAFETMWNGMISGVLPDGMIAGTKGWATEEIDGHPQMDGKKAKVFVAASGWESLEKEKAASAAMMEKMAELKKFTEVFDNHHTTFTKAG